MDKNARLAALRGIQRVLKLIEDTENSAIEGSIKMDSWVRYSNGQVVLSSDRSKIPNDVEDSGVMISRVGRIEFDFEIPVEQV